MTQGTVLMMCLFPALAGIFVVYLFEIYDEVKT
jgi:hypothetical protein